MDWYYPEQNTLWRKISNISHTRNPGCKAAAESLVKYDVSLFQHWSLIVTIYGNPKNNRLKKYETQSIAHQPIHLRQPCELTVCNVFWRAHYQPVTNTRIESFFPGSEHLKSRRTEIDTVGYWSVLLIIFLTQYPLVSEKEGGKKMMSQAIKF